MNPYLGADNLLATLRRGAIPYIPFKINSVPQSGYEPKSTLWTRMLKFYTDNREEFLTHYHKRSNIERANVKDENGALLGRLALDVIFPLN